MSAELQGDLRGQGLKIGIVVARFNEFITSNLLKGAMAALTRYGVADEDIAVAHVPGSFEIPLVAKKIAETGRYDAVVCLGAVIRGETGHYEHIAGEAAKGIAQAGLDAGVPVIFGVLTTDTVDQALARSGGENGKHAAVPLAAGKPGPNANSDGRQPGNSGYNAAVTAIEMANLLRTLSTY